MVGFVRGAAVSSAPPTLDPTQRAVVDLADAASAAVLGAPGTGKTTTLVELVADRVLGRGWHPSEVLALTPIRATATRLRDAIALRLAVPTTGPMARTVNSLAFEIVGDAARAAGTVPPRLVTGGEQDADIAGLLEGHLEDGGGPEWPASLGAEVRGTRRFRSELRELMMRATEFDVSPADLRELGRTLARPEWVASADFMAEYYQVVTASRERQLDQAELAQFASSAIRSEHPGDRVTALQLVVVDDFQESTEATFQILRALASRGISIIAFGDPDVAASSFRGAEPDVLGRLADVLQLPGAGSFTLGTAHRQGEALRQVTRVVTNRIGAAAAGTQRAALARDDAVGGSTLGTEAPVASIEAKTPSREWAAIARELRERHLVHGVPWGDLAVVVRSRGQLDVVRRALTNAEVPVTAATGGVALRDDPTARALLTLVDVGIERDPLTAALASELLLGPFGGLDPLGLRKLRLALRAEDIAGGGSARADDLLVDALGSPARLATIDHRVGRAAAKLATTLQKLRESDGSIEELLWLAWSRSGLAESWHAESLGSGAGASEANRRLDGVVALFTTAKRFAERRPNDPPSVFLSELLDAEVPEDSLSPRSVDDAVVVATPAAMVGREFDTVVVAGLQEGAWPNLRLRGSLLAPHELVRVVLGIDSGSIDERRVVRDDELRMFALAVSRARTRLVVAAVGNDDEAVSPLFQLVAALARPIDASSPPPFTLRGVTGRLRRILAEPTVPARDRASAASTLAALAAEGVPGADPAQWHGLLPISTTQRLFEGEPAPVRPSSIDKLEKSALDWFLESVARTDPGMAANVGTIMHSALELAETTDPNDLWKTVESRWSELAFESQWLEERQKRQMWKFTQALAEYLQDFETSGNRAVAAEGRFEVTIGEAVVRGSIDRVEVSEAGAVVIVDLKTGTPIYKKDVETHPQLAVYQLAYAEGALDEFLLEVRDHTGGGAKLLFVKRGAEGKLYSQAHQERFDAAQLEAFRDRVKVAAGIVAESSFRGVADVVGIFESHALLRLHRVLAVSSD